MSSFSIAFVTPSQAVAGSGLNFTATLSGASNWTNATSSLAAPLTFSGPVGVNVLNMQVTGGNVCTAWIEFDNVTGTVVVTDAVNNTTQTIVVVGSIVTHITPSMPRVYVLGGTPNVTGVTAVVGGTSHTKGSTSYLYQVIANNATGHTAGSPGNTLEKYINLPANDTFFLTNPTAASSRCAVINYAPDTLDGTSNFVTINWNASPGALNYDVVRTPNITPFVWVSVALGVTALTANDTSNSQPSYSLPTTNTTAIGNDSTGNGTIGNPYATCAKACSVATAGQVIHINAGQTCETVECIPATGVNLEGEGMYASVINSIYNSSNLFAQFRPGSNSDINDVQFTTDLSQVVFGTLASDTSFVDCNLNRVYIKGFSNAARLVTTNCGLTATDCLFTSYHGTFGMTTCTGSMVNLNRCNMLAGGGNPSNGATTAQVAAQLNAGFMVASNSLFFATGDSMQGTSLQTAGIFCNSTNIRGGSLTNCTVLGSGVVASDYIFANPSTMPVLYLDFTGLDPVRNPTSAGMNIVLQNQFEYQSPERIVTVIARNVTINES